ncbi:unnamed protein product, partial [Prorocentrum cordatum]
GQPPDHRVEEGHGVGGDRRPQGAAGPHRGARQGVAPAGLGRGAGPSAATGEGVMGRGAPQMFQSGKGGAVDDIDLVDAVISLQKLGLRRAIMKVFEEADAVVGQGQGPPKGPRASSPPGSWNGSCAGSSSRSTRKRGCQQHRPP